MEAKNKLTDIGQVLNYKRTYCCAEQNRRNNMASSMPRLQRQSRISVRVEFRGAAGVVVVVVRVE
eukprot:11857690-Heterocapsa_arctica.AAC.1